MWASRPKIFIKERVHLNRWLKNSRPLPSSSKYLKRSPESTCSCALIKFTTASTRSLRPNLLRSAKTLGFVTSFVRFDSPHRNPYFTSLNEHAENNPTMRLLRMDEWKKNISKYTHSGLGSRARSIKYDFQHLRLRSMSTSNARLLGRGVKNNERTPGKDEWI